MTAWLEVPNPHNPPGGTTFKLPSRHLAAIRSRDLGRWHLSVSHALRVPTWGELGMARDALLPPDVWMMVAHPPRAFWMNLDRRVLHLWEFDDPVLIEQFTYEGQLARAEGHNKPDSGDPIG